MRNQTINTLSIDAALEAVEVCPTPNKARCKFHKGYELDTNHGTEFISDDVVGSELLRGLNFDADDIERKLLVIFKDYIEGDQVYTAEAVEYWCAEWTMSGCLDRGTLHTADSELEALEQLLEHDGSERAASCDDWEADVFQHLAHIAVDGDRTDQDRQRAVELLTQHLPQPEVELSPIFEQKELPTGIRYNGDCNPIPHDGCWFNVDEWTNGYCSAVRIQNYDGNQLSIETGPINLIVNCNGEICDTYNINDDEIQDHHRIDFALNQSGLDSDYDDVREIYTSLDDSGWFIDSEGEMVPESKLQQRIHTIVTNMVS